MKLRINLNHRDQMICSFLAGMLCMGLLFLNMRTPNRVIAAQNEECARSVAVANALYGFVEDQYGTLHYPDGTRILRGGGWDGSARKW